MKGARGWGWGWQELLFTGYEVSVAQDVQALQISCAAQGGWLNSTVRELSSVLGGQSAC